VNQGCKRSATATFFDYRLHIGVGIFARSGVDAPDGQLWAEDRTGPGAIFHLTLPVPVPG
jgi:K+-sensing histidine kinase KdpD